MIAGEWANTCNELQRMLIVRSLRPDRVAICVTTFISNNLGIKFIEPPVLELKQVVDDSTTKTPLIFVLSPGVVSWSLLMFFFRIMSVIMGNAGIVRGVRSLNQVPSLD